MIRVPEGMSPTQWDDFIDGVLACRQGNSPEPGRSEWYQRGYGAQYEQEQRATANSMAGEHHAKQQ